MSRERARPALERRVQEWMEKGRLLWGTMKRRRKVAERKVRELRLEKVEKRRKAEAHRVERKAEEHKKRRRKIAEASRRRNRAYQR